MNRGNHLALSAAEITQASLAGAPVYGRDDQRLGKIARILGYGEAAQLVVNTGGFLGFGVRPVRLGVAELHLMRDEDGIIHGTVAYTREDIADLPRHGG